MFTYFLIFIVYIIFIIIPQTLENNININKIMMFSLIFLFCLNNINNPNPEPVRSPEMQLPKGIIFSRYNCVIITLDAQLGIKPIRLDIMGLNILLLLMNVVNVSLSIIIFNKIFIIRINIDIFIVWIILDLIIPSLLQWQLSLSQISFILLFGLFL